MGTTADDLLLVRAAALFEAGLQVLDELRVDGLLAVAGDVELGNSSSDYLVVHAASTFTGPVSLYSDSTVLASSSVLRFQRRLNTAAVVTGTVLGAVLFTSWDGTTDGPSAQIQSVFMVSLHVIMVLLVCHRQALSFDIDIVHHSAPRTRLF